MASKGDGENIHSSHSLLTNLGISKTILKPLDEALTCRICLNYFRNCMITKCSHNFCSLCIRQYMLYKSQCPTCFQDASEPELRNNRLIDEILRTYVILKETLQCSSRSQNHTQSGDCLPLPSQELTVKKEFISKDDQYPKNDDKNAEANEFQVSCPVCYKPVNETRINIHLDDCLKAQEKEDEGGRKHMPKLVYHLLPDKEIRKKLKGIGLNSAGTRQTLIRRHKNFVTLYNANCDSLEPKPVSELIRELEVQEIEEKANVSSAQIQVHKKSDVPDIEREFESYAKEHRSQFNKLLNDIQQRELDRTVVKQEPIDDILHEPHQSVSKNVPCEESSSEDFSGDSDSSESSRESADVSETPTRIKTPCKLRTAKYETKSLKDSEECDSPSLLDDLEQRTVTQLNLLRKRKKGRVVEGHRSSPKKKDSSSVTSRKPVQS